MRPTDALPHPSAWATAPVGRAIATKRGVSWSKDQEHVIARDYAVPVIRVGNVQSQLLLDDLLYISGLSPSAVEATRVTAGWSIMVGSNGNRNRVGNAVFVSDDAEYLFASFLLGARPRTGSGIAPEFFYRWLTTDRVQAYLSASAEGTTGLSNLSHSFFRKMSIAFPAEAEQRQITGMLDAVDDLLERTQRAAVQSYALKRALLADLLRRGTKNEPQKKTTLGPIPTSWDVKPVGSVVRQFQYGLSMKMAAEGDIPILRMGNIQRGGVVLHGLKYVSLPAPVVESYRLSRGDVLFNRTNSQELVGKVGIYRSDTPSVFASYLIRLVPDPDVVDRYYLGHVLDSYSAQCRIKRYATPGVQQVNVNARNLGRVLIPVPPASKDGLEEQRRIAAILENADEHARRYEVLLGALATQKRSLLNGLMTGSIVPSPVGEAVAG